MKTGPATWFTFFQVWLNGVSPTYHNGSGSPPAREPVEDLTCAAELAAGQHIDQTGALAQLTSEEWLNRWRQRGEHSRTALEWPAVQPVCRRAVSKTLLADPLQGKAAPRVGKLLRRIANAKPPAVAPEKDAGVELDGQQGRLFYAFAGVPATEYSLSFWMKPLKLPEGENFVCDTWHQPWDSPLAVVFENGQLRARIVVGRQFATGGIVLSVGRWHHIAVVRSGEALALYLDGVLRGSARVPGSVSSSSGVFCLGGAPSGDPRCVQARFAALSMIDQAMSAKEVADLFNSGFDGKPAQ